MARFAVNQIAVSIVALCLLAPAALAANGGGSVGNKLPTVETFSTSAGNHNNNQQYSFTGTVDDRNKESDLQVLHVSLESAPADANALPGDRTIDLTDDVNDIKADPTGCAGDGWQVWNEDDNDGVLHFRFCYMYTKVGDYTFRMSVRDEGGFQTGPAADIAKTVVAKLTFSNTPVLATGAVDTGASWGNWTALPGDGATPSLNFMKIQNTGATPTQQFTVDFDTDSFAGPNGDSIPIDDHIQFASCQAASGSTSPTDAGCGSASWSATSSDGAATFTFGASTPFIYIKYQLTDTPSLLSEGTYSTTFTVNAL